MDFLKTFFISNGTDTTWHLLDVEGSTYIEQGLNHIYPMIKKVLLYKQISPNIIGLSFSKNNECFVISIQCWLQIALTERGKNLGN